MTTTYPVSSSITLKYDGNARLTNMVDPVMDNCLQLDESEDGPWTSDTVRYIYDNGRWRRGLNLQAPNKIK